MDWVIDRYYYIINFRDFLKPKIYPVYFINKDAAKNAISVNIPSKKHQAYYEVIRGKKLKEFKATYVLGLGKLGKIKKYVYPKGLKTPKQRKNFRTIMRRRLRRMGMLTLLKTKYNINTPPPIVKLIKNRQEVANCPNTIAKVFRLQRKPKNIYYYILNKHISNKKGTLFLVNVIKVNIDNQKLEIKKIIIRRKDIIIPYLTTELFTLYGNEKKLMDFIRKQGIKGNFK